MITPEQYKAALQIVREYEENLYQQQILEDEDDYDRDLEEEEAEIEAERRMETASLCTCGAWVVNNKGDAIHVADCYCGAE